MAWPGAVTKYSRRSPKLTTISPFLNCGLKRTNSRPLPPIVPPPPQSQNNCAEAGPEPTLIAATMAPAAMLALRKKRAMIIGPSSLSLSSRSPSTRHRHPAHANAYSLVTLKPAPTLVKSVCSAVPFPAGSLSRQSGSAPRLRQRNSSKTAASPAGAGLARAAATLAGPAPRSNPRKRDQGLEKRTLFDPVRFQPHACSPRHWHRVAAQHLREASRRIPPIISHAHARSYLERDFLDLRKGAQRRPQFSRSAKAMFAARRPPLLASLAALFAATQVLA